MVWTKFVNSSQAKNFVKSVHDFEGLSKIRMYKAIPKNIYKLVPSVVYNDKYVDSRIEIKLKQNL